MTGKPEPVAETDPCRGETDLLAALHASITRGRPLAVWCADTDPLTAALCTRLRGHDGQHSPDGVDPWTPPTNTKD